MDTLVLALTWFWKRVTVPLRDRRGATARARHTFYVVTEDGHLVPLGDALAELGLVSDGGK